jgi:DNA polymerase
MLITFDFETFYSDAFSLSRITTEEYIRDVQFEVIGVGVQVDGGQPQWFSGTREETRKWLRQFDWKNSMALAHNTMFDGAILHWVFGITPMIFLDTLSMARALHGMEAGGSLKALAERYQIGVKGTEVVAAKGKTRMDFAPDDLARYGEYCKNDVRLTYDLFHIMSKNFPIEELRLIDITLRMFTHPQLYADEPALQDRLDDLRTERSQLLLSLKDTLQAANEEEVRKKLSSNKQFADVLRTFDLEVPMKISPTTGKETYALAKKDEGFIALTEHENPVVQQLCAVRLGTKSTLEEKRIERFIEVSRRNRGSIPVPLKYYGAHTGRWSGVDKVNFQNLPSRDPKKKALKKAIIPPEGYVVINSDSSQIEARVLAWLAGQEDVVQQFANKKDVYSIFASSVYGRTITKANEAERFVGKTCVLGLGYGTGALKLQHTLATSQPISVKLDEDECKRIVSVYRSTNYKIVELWGASDSMLSSMLNGNIRNAIPLGEHGCLWFDEDGIRLPNNLYIRYPKLRRETLDGKSKVVYDSRKGLVSLWGGAVVENVVQALARIIVGEQMVKINEFYRPALTVHDAVVLVVPEDEQDAAVKCLTEIMSCAPDWAPGLPVACEAKVGATYGDC